MRTAEPRRERRKYPDPKPGMSAMIDVVFLLLIFFLVIIKPQDVVSRFEAATGAPPPPDKPVEEDILKIKIGVERDGFRVQDGRKDYRGLSAFLAGVARYSREPVVMISCADDAPHGRLVQVLDLCHEYKMLNIALTSRPL